MENIIITMNDDGSLQCTDPSGGYIEEMKARQLVIAVNDFFDSSVISYFTISFEPYGLAKKIVTDNIYKDGLSSEVYFEDGNIYCPIFDYIAVSPKVKIQIDGYETDENDDICAIYKSGIMTLNFDESLVGDKIIPDSSCAELKLSDKISGLIDEDLETRSFGTSAIADRAITTDKIASDAVTLSKLSSSVRTSLSKADTALQTHQDISGKANVSDIPAKTSQLTNDSNFVSDASYVHTDNNYTTTEKTKLAGLSNYDDTSITASVSAKYTKPSTGIPKTDLASDVQTSLGKADTALQTHQDISGKANIADVPTKTSDLTNDSNFISDASYVHTDNNYTNAEKAKLASIESFDSATITQAVSAKYTKPATGIPKTDLASDVQTSLGKADTALQSHQDISGKEDASNKVISITSSSTDAQYPSAKCVYDNINDIIEVIGSFTEVFDVMDRLNYGDTLSDICYGFRTLIPNAASSQNQLADKAYVTNSLSSKANASDIPSKTSDLTNDSSFVSDASYVHTDNNYTTAEKTKLATLSNYDDTSISASVSAKYTKPATGIPKTDLASDVQISLGKADTALQAHQDISGKANIADIPTKLSDLTDDLGNSPTHTHSQYLTSHQDISAKENTSNKVTSLSSSSTDTQYPSAKCVYDHINTIVGDIESLLSEV